MSIIPATDGLQTHFATLGGSLITIRFCVRAIDDFANVNTAVMAHRGDQSDRIVVFVLADIVDQLAHTLIVPSANLH